MEDFWKDIKTAFKMTVGEMTPVFYFTFMCLVVFIVFGLFIK